MNKDCPFCNLELAEARFLVGYRYWNLFLQSDEKRLKTRQAAGFLAAKRHFREPSDATAEEWAELQSIVKLASKTLCRAVSLTYLSQEVVGFNQGVEAGQTVGHAHVHVLPIADEDPEALKIRSGIGGAFEALHRERMGK
jgi:diadenosine tetraphosphate (Ap4A) HIT family hydrolase